MKINTDLFYIAEHDSILILDDKNEYKPGYVEALYDFDNGDLMVVTDSKMYRYISINRCIKQLSPFEIYLLETQWNRLKLKFEKLERKLFKINRIYLKQYYLGITLQSKLQKIEIKRNKILIQLTFLKPLVSCYLNDHFEINKLINEYASH
ncbi:hypothetical protein [Siansivirga zeaxanthinifaciens]|uniref:Uncharacterized protein n=1 Tax=Siansivirga zeaxanthinifaciens CC-SAMT-1 TaxID=1454006 RepID=A0A0C5WQ00_9FLAO|nr:hypothetical protein [Siansivirga zeaxanthinifaciens]AJR05025.1 hypothetical protein AW14_14715 [Siansivirga zeaxanthinifaciens CC-SAMT-1]